MRASKSFLNSARVEAAPAIILLIFMYNQTTTKKYLTTTIINAITLAVAKDKCNCCDKFIIQSGLQKMYVFFCNIEITRLNREDTVTCNSISDIEYVFIILLWFQDLINYNLRNNEVEKLWMKHECIAFIIMYLFYFSKHS